MKTLGTPADTTEAATAGLLSFLDQNGPKVEVGQLFDVLPGARDLMASAKPAAAAGGGGMLGGLGVAAAALRLGKGEAAGLVGAVQ